MRSAFNRPVVRCHFDFFDAVNFFEQAVGGSQDALDLLYIVLELLYLGLLFRIFDFDFLILFLLLASFDLFFCFRIIFLDVMVAV